MKKLTTKCIECGESREISTVDAQVIEITGHGHICPLCVIQMTEEIEEEQRQHDILTEESKSSFHNPQRLYYENKH